MKFKIKNHRISTKIEFSGLKIEFIRKKNLEQFWSKFAPPKFRLIKYQRVPLLVMTILCKTKLLFVAAAVIIKNLLFTFLILISPYVWTQEFLIKFIFQYQITLSHMMKFEYKWKNKLQHLNFILSSLLSYFKIKTFFANL